MIGLSSGSEGITTAGGSGGAALPGAAAPGAAYCP